MNNNFITVVINNYDGKKVTYQMPEDSLVETCKTQIIRGKNEGMVTQVEINLVCTSGIKIIEEDLD